MYTPRARLLPKQVRLDERLNVPISLAQREYLIDQARRGGFESVAEFARATLGLDGIKALPATGNETKN